MRTSCRATADTELLEPSDDDSVADAAASTLSPDAAAALARGGTVLDDSDDAQDVDEFRRPVRCVAARAAG